MRFGRFLAAILPCALALSGCVTPRIITTRTLLAELTDLRSLAEYPEPAFTCRQYSSYDRQSSSPLDANTWFANADVGQYLRIEERDGRKEHVLMDAKGPGAIVRIWSANPKGTLRFYLDESPSPTFEVSMSDLLGGKVTGIPVPIAHVAGTGWNCYFPIPYARRCKVTSDEGGFYYHVNYRTYPRGTPIETFDPQELSALAGDAALLAERLSNSRRANAVSLPPPELAQISPGGTATWQPGRRGPGVILNWRATVSAPDVERALRQLLLTADFDGERTVCAPLGDFFGAGPGVNPYESLALGIADDGEFWCHWNMPYRETARVQLRNLGDQNVRVSWSFAVGAYRWTERSMHFHAGWKVARDVPTRPFSDFNYLDVAGQGVFVGAAFTLLNPTKQWWGEGDEKIYVDGEQFPSHFGTGTEDYYGYAWGNNQRFVNAFHSQPRCDGPFNYGRVAVNRWHVLDRIPFRTGFRFDMEIWHWWEGSLPEISVTTYWYAKPGASANTTEPAVDDLGIATLPPYVAPRVAGAIEGEEMTIVERDGDARPQEIDGCSNDKQILWRSRGTGDRLVLSFAAPAAGRYRVLGRFVKAKDYGVVRIAINDQPVSQAIDFYERRVILSEEALLGVFTLMPSDNRFTVTAVGGDEAVEGRRLFGLDYLRVEPVE